MISLTLPKLGAKDYKGVHYIGGRFIPEAMIEKYKWNVPKYEGTETVLEL